MTRDRRRLLRLRLLVAIVAGTAVGTMHALVSHVVTRSEAATSVEQSVARPTGSHAAAR